MDEILRDGDKCNVLSKCYGASLIYLSEGYVSFSLYSACDKWHICSHVICIVFIKGSPSSTYVHSLRVLQNCVLIFSPSIIIATSGIRTSF